MDYQTDLCCICLCNDKVLEKLSVIDSDNITYFIKLTSTIPEMCYNEINEQRLTCNECRDTIDIIYEFRQVCLRNRTIFIDYVTKLHLESIARDKADVYNNQQIILDNESETSDLDSKYQNEAKCKSIDFQNVEKTNVGFKIKEDLNQILTENKDKNIEKLLHETYDIPSEKPNIVNVGIEIDNVNSKYSDKYIECCDDPLGNLNEFNTIIAQNIKSEIIEIEEDNFDEHLEENIDDPLEFIDGTTNNAESITSYEITENPRKSELLTCKICQKSFKYHSTLKIHEQIHTTKTEQPHTCNTCHKTFKHACNLIMHQRTHIEKIYEFHTCNICQKTFKLKYYLKLHLRIHTKEKPYTCSVCGKKFGQKPALIVHMRTHTGEKPYGCDICSKKFSQSVSLNRHKVIHTGLKPFQCIICDKKFISSQNCKIHMQTHATKNKTQEVLDLT